MDAKLLQSVGIFVIGSICYVVLMLASKSITLVLASFSNVFEQFVTKLSDTQWFNSSQNLPASLLVCWFMSSF